jgi:alkylation response protein AidB-like acyl-CoA dehydrogenase
MCLTEPHAGSDLGLARTKAVPLPDGQYAVSGTKIFISGGEHDMTDNIVHLVLARLPDAPPGPKGLSLFLVPKFYPDGSRSRVHCDRIEEKMGLHGSPTCVMRFDEAVSSIVGEPGKGLNAMFVMMNAARLHVALQGIGLLDAAWQKADAYAQERRQMRAPGKGKSAAEADFISEHPAMRRILDAQRAWVDAGRVLAYRTALELDLIKHSADEATQAAAQRWCALVTPVMKSVFTHQAFHGGSDCLQVFGGHGYVREWGIEQIVRDARVAMIYEGTNEIQAIDLLGRKVLADGGTGMNALLDTIASDLPKAAKASTAAQARIQTLRAVTQQIVKASAQDAALAYRVADDYLRAVALVLMDWAWLRIEAGVDDSTPNAQARWTIPAKALRSWVLPEFQMRSFIIVQQCTLAA